MEEGEHVLRYQLIFSICSLAVFGQLLTGCAQMVQVAMVGAGKSAVAEDTGFLSSYQGLSAVKNPSYPNLPDLSYVSPQARVGTYSRVLMPDFTSMTKDISKLQGLQIRQYKSIKTDLPDQITSTFDGLAFKSLTRTSERIDPRDIDAIKKLKFDAVFMGNIKEISSTGGEGTSGLTSIQVEYKLVDVRTGQEVVTSIHRSTTDLDKVAMSQVRVLTDLLSMAKSVVPSGPVPVAAPLAAPLPPPPTAAPPAPLAAPSSPPSREVTAQAQAKLNALGFNVGKPDGMAGPRTRQAIQQFQKSKGLEVNGQLDGPTLSSLGL